VLEVQVHHTVQAQTLLVQIQFLVQSHQQAEVKAAQMVMVFHQMMLVTVALEAEVLIFIQAVQKTAVQEILHQFLHLKEITVVVHQSQDLSQE
jgi:hypothetical protein